ncbi:hypothetical protein GPALN_007444 [Globodera pallida]|nr:hypothetical protein GPALN_007444 [Globodera pallida]
MNNGYDFAFSPGNFSTPFLPPIVPTSASATLALSPPFVRCFRQYTPVPAMFRVQPRIATATTVFVRVKRCQNDEGEEEEEEKFCVLHVKNHLFNSAISSNQREPLRRPLIVEELQPNCQPVEVFNEDAGVEQSLTFDMAQEILAEQRSPQLVRKLYVVRCNRMAIEMVI